VSDDAKDRALVALACRVMAAAGLFDMHGHISLRDGDVAYINGRRSSRISVTAAQVAVVKVADGSVVSGEPPAETALHLGCYRARPEIRSVAHFHPLAATAFATVGKPLITAFNAGAPFGKAVPVYDDPDLVRNDSQGSAMARDLGKHRAVLLRGHGVAVVAEDVPSCVTLSLYLDPDRPLDPTLTPARAAGAVTRRWTLRALRGNPTPVRRSRVQAQVRALEQLDLAELAGRSTHPG